MGNKNMHKARRNKRDEFYTMISDIEKEVLQYKEQFKNKIVYCNCDDPAYFDINGELEIGDNSSNFWNFFYLQFQNLQLKKLIATHYNENGFTFKYEYDGDKILKSKLDGNGDFRSDESIEFLKETDIVCTNPPFSLFREYVAQLIKYDKQFLIMGNNNAITYKEIFPLIKDNKIWLGYHANKTMEFRLPDHYEKWDRIDEKGNKYGKVPAISWFTNMKVSKRNEEMFLYQDYYGNEDKYPKYDNYNAIEVSRVKNIPRDYEGVMGVPITFLTKYNPNQFEILGMAHGLMGQEIGVSSNLTEEQCKEYYKRNKSFRKGFVCYTDKNNNLKVPYMRILIKNKHLENQKTKNI